MDRKVPVWQISFSEFCVPHAGSSFTLHHVTNLYMEAVASDNKGTLCNWAVTNNPTFGGGGGGVAARSERMPCAFHVTI